MAYLEYLGKKLFDFSYLISHICIV